MLKRVCATLFTGIFILTLLGCSSNVLKDKVYSVSRDTSWYPLDLMGKGDNMLAFSDDLLQQVAKDQGFRLSIRSTGWNNLIPSLLTGSVDAVLSSKSLTDSSLDQFSFSASYLNIGDVLVIPEGASATALGEMEGKLVSVRSGPSLGTLIVEKFPSIFIEYYTDVAQALEDLVAGKVDGVVLGLLPAYAFCQNLYQGKLRVATGVLNQRALRLMTVKGKHPELIVAFDEGVAHLQANGTYDLLLKKWGLNQ